MSKISKLKLNNCQIKSADKLKEVCGAIDVLEKETFIGSGMIMFNNVFICPDIDLIPFYESADPTERLISGICIQLHVKRYGKHSDRRYLKIVKEK
jgi:hypothetical protein